MEYYQKTNVFWKLNKRKTKMNTKNLMVFCLAFVALITAFGVVSADEITSNYNVEVEGLNAYPSGGTPLYIGVIAGDYITVDVYFTSLVDDTDVTVELDLEGEKDETHAESSVFDIEENSMYHKKIKIEVPYELKDEISDEATLSIEIDGKDHKTVLPDITLKIQRPSYNAVIKSITTPSSINAGESFPVDFVLKNIGYNDLDDVYVEARIPELGVSQGPMWLGDLVNLEECKNDCEKDDTVSGRLYLDAPYSTDAGMYTLELTVYNDDLKVTETKTIVIGNDFSEEVIVVTTDKTVRVGEEATFSMLLVNPTNNVKVYKIVTEPTEGISASASSTIVAVPAGSSKTVEISAEAAEEGVFTFGVNVLSGDSLVETVNFNLEAEGKTSNTTVILTVILAIIFLVLLVILIVLLGRKPEKSEDFGESYY